MDVGASVVRAGVAPTAFNKRSEIALKTSIRDVETAVGRINRRIACHARGIHAVECIGTGLDASEEVIGLRNPQKMARTVLRKLRTYPGNDRSKVFLLKGATDPKAVEDLSIDIHFSQCAGGDASKILVLSTLNDSP